MGTGIARAEGEHIGPTEAVFRCRVPGALRPEMTRPGQAPGFDDSLWDSKPIPGRWPAGGYPESGQVGWYRLTVKLLADGGFGPLDDSHLALLAGKITSAFEAYAGGHLLGGAGKLPPFGRQ